MKMRASIYSKCANSNSRKQCANSAMHSLAFEREIGQKTKPAKHLARLRTGE